MTGEELYLFFQQETPAGIRRAWAENPEDVAYRNALSDYARDQGLDELADIILVASINHSPRFEIWGEAGSGFSHEGFYAGDSYYRFRNSGYVIRS